MRNTLYKSFIEAGLIQFGYFDGAPIKVNLELLPSYPEILDQLASEAVNHINSFNPERLVSTLDALPLSILISHKTQIPVVYDLGKHDTPVHSLIGAYDVGHPSVLVNLQWEGEQKTTAFLKNTRSVGLNIQGIISVLNADIQQVPGSNVISLIELDDFVSYLTQENLIPAGQAAAVRLWMRDHNAG